jgi:glycosyltransferase EpsD
LKINYKITIVSRERVIFKHNSYYYMWLWLAAMSGQLGKRKVMRKKILYCASTTSHILNFHLPYLKAFHDYGFEVWVASDTNEPIAFADHVVALPLHKRLMSYQNVKAIFMIKHLLEKEKFDIVSTHTTLASAVVRAAIIPLHRKPNVFCTVHGYLFNENDGLKKWISLIPEKICSSVTNVLMVMNHEDYNIAEKHKLYRDKLYYIDGMGIDLRSFTPPSRNEHIELRKKQGFTEDDFLFLYAAEFSKRKNQKSLIRAFASVSQEHPKMKLLLAGDGALLEECKSLAKELQAEEKIQFLGYVKDMKALYAIIDAVVSTSRIEGLPFNVMEAMACGLPVIASKIKGHIELVSHEETGVLFELEDQAGLEEALIGMFNDREKRKKMGQNGMNGIEQFGLDRVFHQIMEIYRENI